MPSMHKRRKSMQGTSIIITFYQGLSSLELCLSLVSESRDSENEFEIIIANDNPDMNIESIAHKYHARLINMQHNMGYAGACNVAANEAKYDTLVFMDCDIYPTTGWLQHMRKTFADINGNGCVSATIYEADTGNLFGYGMGVYEVDILLFLRHGIPTGFSSQDRNVPIVSSGCMMVSRDNYLRLGGQDEKCVNIHCDVDFSFRMLKNGFQNRMCAKAKVYHRGQVSGPIRTIPFKQDVKAYLFQKWGTEMTTLCQTPVFLQKVWSYFHAEPFKNKNIVVISLSNSLYRDTYISMLLEQFDMHILQMFDIKNVTGNDSIILQEVLSWDFCRLNVPILYFTDDYRNLMKNYYWFANRGYRSDLIADKNGNLLNTADFHWNS